MSFSPWGWRTTDVHTFEYRGVHPGTNSTYHDAYVAPLHSASVSTFRSHIEGGRHPQGYVSISYKQHSSTEIEIRGDSPLP